MPLFNKIFGDENSRFLKRAFKVVFQINVLEEEYKKLSDEELKNKSQEFKSLFASGETLDSILPKAFAACREASVRTLGQRHFDAQLIGGIALHEGKIAEMRTGEGKTLTATLAIYLNALSAKGAHVITVNDYLARRDAVWMGQIYNALGLSIGCINHDTSYLYDANSRLNSKLQIPNTKQITNSNVQNSKEDEIRDIQGGFKVVHEFLRSCTRKEAYLADITYGTNNEYGFDYLRDNLIYENSQLAQRSQDEGGWNYAIVDEVDSILIDEARTPLIISQPDQESGVLYQKFARIVPQLKAEEHYKIDEKMRSVVLTQEGISKVEKLIGIKNLYDEGGARFVHHLEQALKAGVLFKRDKDYIVKEGEVIIVDEFTGRLMPGRRYSEGLHQAIEAKENVIVNRESRTVATITFQNYFRLYKKLAGMSGTAATSQEEFHKVYNLDVAVIPTNKPMIREDGPDMIYRSEKGKYQAVLRKVKELSEKGQPVLIGTGSIEKNEHLGMLLNQIGVPHKVLNAKNHEAEAQIIAQAGKPGAVTLATNIAGRGVDIILGGNPPDQDEANKIKDFGGLFVLGTERHEARRIDNQLRGRSGRQGDPGKSQFFVSLEDDLMRVFGGDKIKNMMRRFNIPEDEAIQSGLVSRAIEAAQTKIEGYHFDVRKHVLEYDEVMNKHREVIYKMRREFISSNLPTGQAGVTGQLNVASESTNQSEIVSNAIKKNKEKVLEILFGEVEGLVSANVSEETNKIDLENLLEGLLRIFPSEEIKTDLEKIGADKEKLVEFLQNYVEELYKKRESEIGSDSMRQIEKIVLLRTIDELWMDHLEEMEYLRDSVGLRAYGQRDPLVEYKTEGHRIFQNFLGTFENQVSGLIFKVGIAKNTAASEQRTGDYNYNDNQKSSASNQARSEKIGRNDPCPCGAKHADGRPIKYKHCHGK
jgi:preprotein translocase subunit SecA